MKELNMNAVNEYGIVNAKRLRRLQTMDIRADWRRMRRYARIGVALFDSMVVGRKPESMCIAKYTARNAGK